MTPEQLANAVENLLARLPDLSPEMQQAIHEGIRQPEVCASAVAILAEKGNLVPSPALSGDSTVTAPPGPPRKKVASPLPMIAGYEIEKELGKGGMGIVYLARHAALKRHVALKMLLGGSGSVEERSRFQKEAQAVARLNHPNIVHIYENGEHQGRPYFSLELVHGDTLSRKLAGTPQPPRQAAQLVEVLARAMHFAHQHGIIHRDLKPANILLATPTNSDTGAETCGAQGYDHCIPKISDFGLAKHLNADEGQTHSGAVMGTPSYMSPEQASGMTKDIGPLTDVYALGAILYEMLTGRPPFRGQSPLDTLDQVRNQEVVPLRQIQPTTPHDLETICLKCLEKDLRRRYENAEELAKDLRRFQDGEPIKARPVGPRERLAKWTRCHPALAGVIVLGQLSLALLVGVVVVLWNNRELDSARKEADRQRNIAQNLQKEADRLKKIAQDQLPLAVLKDKQPNTKQAVDQLTDWFNGINRWEAENMPRTSPRNCVAPMED